MMVYKGVNITQKCYPGGIPGSVNGVRSEPSMEQAYDQMRMKIFNNTMTLPLNMGQVSIHIARDLK